MSHTKSLLAFSLAFHSLLLPHVAFAACFVRGEAAIPGLPGSIAGTAESSMIWDDNERITFTGDQLPSQLGQAEGENLVYRGPAVPGFVVFGPYENVKGFQTAAQPSLRFSIDWSPDGEEYCSNKKKVFSKGNKCVEKSWRAFPTSFTVDITAKAGTQIIYQKQFDNIHQVRFGRLDLPSVECDGAIEGLEVRIRDLQGGSGTFTIHELMVDKYWKY